MFFAGPEDFRAWLETNHDSASELWMGLTKKHVSPRGLTWAEAVPEALCFGWIDSTSQRIDDDARRQRWTPRKSGSIWSNVNIKHVERLIAEGRMQPAGLAAYVQRRDDRTGIYSHEQHSELGPDHVAALRADPAASAFWDEATATYRRNVAAWILGAKQEATRAKRLAQLIDDSAAGRLVPPQRYGATPRWVERASTAAAQAHAASDDNG